MRQTRRRRDNGRKSAAPPRPRPQERGTIMKKSTSILTVLLAILFLPVLVVAKVMQLQR